jgi:hypothetical protein
VRQGEEAAEPADLPAGRSADGITAEFRATSRQLRNLLIAIGVLFASAVVAGWACVRTGSGGFLVLIVAVAGFSAVLLGGCYVVLARSRTVIDDRGIRWRLLAAWYEREWAEIGSVACRVISSRGSTAYRVVLNTTDGDRVSLGAPTSGGVMADPQFSAKFQQIRGTWQRATGRTGEEIDARSIYTRAFVAGVAAVAVQITAVVTVVSILSVSGPALAAREGRGTPGVFTAQIRSCQQSSCTWYGSFTAAGKTRNAELAAGGPHISAPGRTVAAVDTGDRYSVFPKGGGTSWEGPAIGLGIAAAFLLAILAGQVAMLLRRRHRRRTGRPRPAPASLSGQDAGS